VVSYAPALTQIIVDLGAADTLVAVAENDAAAPKDIPLAGNYLDLDTEVLLTMRPTHVMMMYGQGGVPQVLTDLAKGQGFELITYPYPQNVADVEQIIWSSDDAAGTRPMDAPPSIAFVLERQAAGRMLGFSISSTVGQLGALAEDRGKHKSVLMLFNTNPPMASGPGTVLDDMLTMLLRADNAVGGGDATGSAPELDKEMLLTMNPDVILLLLPNAPPLTALADDPRLAVFRDMNITAVRDQRIVLINDPLVLLPSSSSVRIGIKMAKAIYPELIGDFDKVLAQSDAP